MQHLVALEVMYSIAKKKQNNIILDAAMSVCKVNTVRQFSHHLFNHSCIYEWEARRLHGMCLSIVNRFPHHTWHYSPIFLDHFNIYYYASILGTTLITIFHAVKLLLQHYHNLASLHPLYNQRTYELSVCIGATE